MELIKVLQKRFKGRMTPLVVLQDDWIMEIDTEFTCLAGEDTSYTGECDYISEDAPYAEMSASLLDSIFELMPEDFPDFYDEDTTTKEKTVAWIGNRRAMLLTYQHNLEQEWNEGNIFMEMYGENPWSEKDYECLKRKIQAVDNELGELAHAEIYLCMESLVLSKDICSEFTKMALE